MFNGAGSQGQAAAAPPRAFLASDWGAMRSDRGRPRLLKRSDAPTRADEDVDAGRIPKGGGELEDFLLPAFCRLCCVRSRLICRLTFCPSVAIR